MNSFEFDFDDWAELATRDSEAFARRRERVVEEVCERFGGHANPWIAGICWRIDIERKRCSSPMQLCLQLSSLMWKRHAALSEKINELKLMLIEQQMQYRLLEQRQRRLVVVSSCGVKRDSR